MPRPLDRLVATGEPVDLGLTLGPLRRGPYDPTIRIGRGVAWRATRTPAGPATLRIVVEDGGFRLRAWGEGADWALERGGDLLGAADDLGGWHPERHPLLASLNARFGSFRFPATWAVLEAAIPSICEQKVTAQEAHRSWRRMVRALGESAPGPPGLMLPPSAGALAQAPYWAYHRFGLERRRTEAIKALASRAGRVEEASSLPARDRRARLEAFPGIGVWTSAKVAEIAWADADAVAVGDYHVAPVVVHALTGRRGGDDDAMLELLEPFRPHRARAARLLMLSGLGPERRHHGYALRDIRAL